MSQQRHLGRRAFVGSAALSGLFTGLFGIRTQAIGTEPTAGVPPVAFADLASFLTGSRSLDTKTVERAWAGLAKVESDFATRASALRDAVIRGGFADVNAFAKSPIAAEAELAATAKAIIAAFYTGRVGSGPDTLVVGYEDALMYRPTLRTTTIPTYASGGAGWWAMKPDGAVGDA